MSDRPRILGLQHVALPYPGTPESVVQARHFFGEVLGLRELVAPAALDDVLWFAAGEQEIHLVPEPSGVAVNSEVRRHPCFEVDDVGQYRSRVADAGVSIIEPHPPLPGRPRFFALDPFGNALEFIQMSG